MLACAGDIPTLETLAAAAILLRQRLPELKVRCVNVVDLMRLQPDSEHPHGSPIAEFDALFPPQPPLIFAFHGYPWLDATGWPTGARTIPTCTCAGTRNAAPTTTPFDMVRAQRPRPGITSSWT